MSFWFKIAGGSMYIIGEGYIEEIKLKYYLKENFNTEPQNVLRKQATFVAQAYLLPFYIILEIFLCTAGRLKDLWKFLAT